MLCIINLVYLTLSSDQLSCYSDLSSQVTELLSNEEILYVSYVPVVSLDFSMTYSCRP